MRLLAIQTYITKMKRKFIGIKAGETEIGIRTSLFGGTKKYLKKSSKGLKKALLGKNCRYTQKY